MTYGHQRFYEHWCDSSAGSKFCDTFPYVLSLGEPDAFVPFGFAATPGNQIVVTKSYDDMFHPLLRLRNDDEGDSRGAVLTGQSGIGMSR